MHSRFTCVCDHVIINNNLAFSYLFPFRSYPFYLCVRVCIDLNVIVIDLFSETVLFNHRGGRSPPRLLNRQSS